FNDINAMTGAMWGVDLTADQGIGLISFWGQMDIFSYSYQWAGNIKAMDESLYAQIPANDIRRGQFGSYIVDYVPYNKFYHSGRTTGGQRQVTADLLYMRVAEMYLLAAEGYAETGREADAKTMLKALVNQRLEAGSNADYIDGLSGSALQDEIKLQSRIELWGEGKSYLRMKRQRETITRGSNWLDFPNTTYSFDDEKLTFEIPEAEMRDNPLISDQN
ncbi:MAG: RagB/SusD family nutrient uptake outer membrane protein, partial [Flavobacteriaceae bacterium]